MVRRVEPTMYNDLTNDQISNASPGTIQDSQKTDEQTAMEVLQAMQEDLPENQEWAMENISATLELLQQYMNRR